MKVGDKAKASPQLTGESDWVEGVVIDIEQNPFKGIVIAIKDKVGRIFFGEEDISSQLNYRERYVCDSI